MRRSSKHDDGCPEQLALDLGANIVTQRPGEGWKAKRPTRWTRREAQAYQRRAQAAGKGDGEAQQECLTWLDWMLKQPVDPW